MPPESTHGAYRCDLPTISIGGIPIARAGEPQCVDHIIEQAGRGQGGWVITVNLDILRRFQRDTDFAQMCAPANLIVADGRPLLWVARAQGTPFPGQVAGSSLVWTLSAGAARAGRSLFLLGGDEGTAEAAAQELSRRYPGIRIVGTLCPPVGFDRDDAAMQSIAQTLTAVRPDIVYVALGSPKQERVISRLRPLLPAAWWLGVGISFSYMCGRVRRAPPWMQRLGLEWLHRLSQEPRRLAHRYLVVGIPFFLRLYAAAAWHRVHGGHPNNRPTHRPAA